MIRFLSTVLLAMFAASFAHAIDGIGGTVQKRSDGYRIDLPSTKSAGTYLIGEAMPNAVVGFELGAAFVGTLYACDTQTYAAGTCTAFPTTLSADIENSGFNSTRRFYLLTITTPESGSNVSRLNIYGSFILGGSSRLQPVFYAENYGGKTLAAINAALSACDTWAQANKAKGTVMLPRGKVQYVVSGSDTSPLISLPEYANVAGAYNASCDLVGHGSVKDYFPALTIPGGDPVGSSIFVYYPDSMTATNGYKAVIYAPGHGQIMKGFNLMIAGDASTDIDGTTANLSASSTAGSRTFGASGIKRAVIEDVSVSTNQTGYGVGLTTFFWLENTLTKSWFYGLQYGWVPMTLAGTSNNANHVAHNAFKSSNVGIYINGSLSCQDMPLFRNTFEGNVYGLRMTSTQGCKVSSHGNHWEQGDDLSVVGINDVLIEGTAGSFSSFGDSYDGHLPDGAHIVRTAAQTSNYNWDVVEGGYFRDSVGANTIKPYTYTNGAGIRVNGSAPNIVTTTGTATAKMNGEVHIADHATAASDVDYTLPTAFAGRTGCFYDNGGGDGGVIIDAATGDEILLYGAGVGVADAIDSPGVAGAGANGDFICLQAIDDTYWITLGGSGTGVDGGGG